MKTIEPLPPGCSLCHGASHIGGPSGAKRCACARGQALAAMETARKQERRSPKKRAVRNKPAFDGRAAAVGDK